METHKPQSARLNLDTGTLAIQTRGFKFLLRPFQVNAWTVPQIKS
jgi:hypothetical protein